MKKIVKDPLFHFLVAGVFLFVFWEYGGGSADPDTNRIIVGPAQIDRIEAAWKKQMRRPTTDNELKELIEQFVQEEVLFREAMAMGLDKDDTIVRRRLVQKMRFLIQDIVDQKQPGEAELKAYFNENKDLFRSPAKISFTHIYFSQDRRGDAAVNDAKKTLEYLNETGVARSPKSGDPFMLHYDYSEITESETNRLFGNMFSTQVFKLRPGAWQGPIQSGYGVHLARVIKKIPSYLPEFKEAIERVSLEYMGTQRKKANEEAIKNLRKRYRIVLDEDAANRNRTQTASGSPSGEAS
ncbi:MAG: peptidyl-prolyl cis-trans isomerase [Desulfobacterales bacterium]|nr:peptidyl-prolyl cis-trans isomerase [Desulfobacterales bacterium]